jgi:hypothetical protein
MQKRSLSLAVAGALAAPPESKVAERARQIAKRRLTCDIRIEAEAADESPLAPVVSEALMEWLEKGGGAVSGMFESKSGADVHWRACNEFFDADGIRLAHDGSEKERYPIPVGIAHISQDGRVITIRGIRFDMSVFQMLAHPDPAKKYSFARDGDVVIVKEV